MSSILYAAYGSNLHPKRVSERVESLTLLGTSYISDKGFRFNKRSKDLSAKGNIVEANEGVYVAIYELDSSSKSTLDRIEGLGFGYNEAVLDIPEYGECLTYVAQPSAIDDSLLPYYWYKRLVLLGCQYHQFPHEYVEFISNFDETGDGNDERHAENMRLVERIEYGA